MQPQLTNQGIVSSHMNYLPGTPSPTFPGLQPSILQSSGEDNFQIDFLHDSDVRGTCSIYIFNYYGMYESITLVEYIAFVSFLT